MKKLLLFLSILFLISCSKDEEPEKSDKLTSYSSPELHLGETMATVESNLGEPDFEFSPDNIQTKWTYMSDIPGWHSVDFNFSGEEVSSTVVRFEGSEENLTFIKNHLESLYGAPEELIEQGGIYGLRYPVRYPLTDLYFSEDGSVIYIEYTDLENPNVG